MSKHTDILLEAVQEIAEIIYMELPLRYQDQWLENIMAKGMWKPEEPEDGSASGWASGRLPVAIYKQKTVKNAPQKGDHIYISHYPIDIRRTR